MRQVTKIDGDQSKTTALHQQVCNFECLRHARHIGFTRDFLCASVSLWWTFAGITSNPEHLLKIYRIIGSRVGIESIAHIHQGARFPPLAGCRDYGQQHSCPAGGRQAIYFCQTTAWQTACERVYL